MAKSKKSRRSDLERYSVAELEAMPTISQGHTDNLKVEDEIDGIPTKWWLSRMSVEDGQKYAVEVEQYVQLDDDRSPRWQVVHGYGRPRRYVEMFPEENPAADDRAQRLAARLAQGIA